MAKQPDNGSEDDKVQHDNLQSETLLRELAFKLRERFREVMEEPIPPDILDMLDELEGVKSDIDET